MSLDRCFNIEMLRARARNELPAPLFHYIDGGADDEEALRGNLEAFGRYHLMPRTLVNVSDVRLDTHVLGQTLKMPLFLAPTGMSRLFHHHAELGAAKAAEAFGTLYALSTLGTTSLEDIAAAITTPTMFQIYILKDRALTREFVERCKAAGYAALCLTADMPVAGNRERDLITGMVMPPRFTLSSIASFALHWRWALNLLLSPGFTLANVAHRVDALSARSMSLIDYVNSQFDRSVTWDDVAWLIELWNGPFVIKGLLAVDDVVRAADVGASAVMISNHGGRQLGCAPAPVDLVAPMRDAVGDRLELIVDGGIRRGAHVLKALALGADACSIGKAYLYGLGAGGRRGVERALDIFRSEIARGMALLGCPSIGDIGPEHIVEIDTLDERGRANSTQPSRYAGATPLEPAALSEIAEPAAKPSK